MSKTAYLYIKKFPGDYPPSPLRGMTFCMVLDEMGKTLHGGARIEDCVNTSSLSGSYLVYGCWTGTPAR